jgi:hypothetical protein
MSLLLRLAAVTLGLALFAPAARAQLASRPHDDDEAPIRVSDHRGLYVGIGAGVGAQFSSGLDTKLGLQGEAKIGFSFNRQMQLYLAGSAASASGYNTAGFSGSSQQLYLITAHLRRMALVDRSGIGVYGNAGIGIGIASPGFGPLGQSAIGLGASGGIGVEIPVGRNLSLAPELYIRSVQSATAESVSGNIYSVGLQLGVVYY